MTDFNIDSNFQINSFNNAINEYNKSFNNSIKDTSKAYFNTDKSFQEIFNSFSDNKPIEAGIEYQAETNIKDISPTEKMASEIGDGLRSSLRDLNSIQKDSEVKAEFFAAGGDISVHDVMIAAQKSNLAMQMAVQLRNRVVSAYNELKNISI